MHCIVKIHPLLTRLRFIRLKLEKIAVCQLPTPFGIFKLHGFIDTQTNKEHLALVMGEITTSQPTLIRVHSECLTGDALFSQRCDCGDQLKHALSSIAQAESGLILYLRQEGRGIGLINKIRAYELQDQGADTVEANEQLGFSADLRTYEMCQPMLESLGIKQIKLMTNNPKKVKALKQAGVDVVERVPIEVPRTQFNNHYLNTKALKLGHMLTHQDDGINLSS